MLRVIDTETCDLQGGVVEIASVDVVDGKIVNPMSHLVRPDRPISAQAMAIHRITEEMVADKPWIEEVVPFYQGSPWYVAHNASFDRRVLPEMDGEWICTMKMARRLWPGIKYSNMALYKSRKLSVATPPGLHHHRALYDCYITAALLIDIIQAIRARGISVLLIEHDMGLVMGVSERILVMEYGRPIALGTPEAIQKDERVIKAYLGEE